MEPSRLPSEAAGKKMSAKRRNSAESVGSSAGESVQEDGESRQMKKTCENCVKCKIRCEGGNPCTRCLKRGVDCVFLVEQKRGRRPGPLASTSAQTKRTRTVEKEAPSTTTTTMTMTNEEQDLRKGAIASPPNQAPVVASHHYHHHHHLHTSQQEPSFVQPTQQLGGTNPFLMQQQFLTNSQMMLLNSNPLVGGAWQGALPGSFMSISGGSHLPMIPNAGTSAPVEPLNVFERRMIRTLFALFKHHHTANDAVSAEALQRLNWFDVRFGFLAEFLRPRITPHELKSFKVWMSARGMNPAASEKHATLLLATTTKSPKFANPKREFSAIGEQVKMKLGTVSVMANGCVECDAMIQQLLGYNAQYFARKQGWPSGGLVPWGTEILAQIAARDEDVFAYAQQVLSRLSSVSESRKDGTISVKTESTIQVVHRSNIVMDCTIAAEVLEVEAPSIQRSGGAIPILQGVAINMYMANPGTHSPIDVTSTFGVIPELGPWPSHGSTSWMNSLLAWA